MPHATVEEAVAPARRLFRCDAELRGDLIVLKAVGGAQHNTRTPHLTRRKDRPRDCFCSTAPYSEFSSTCREMRIARLPIVETSLFLIDVTIYDALH